MPIGMLIPQGYVLGTISASTGHTLHLSLGTVAPDPIIDRNSIVIGAEYDDGSMPDGSGWTGLETVFGPNQIFGPNWSGPGSMVQTFGARETGVALEATTHHANFERIRLTVSATDAMATTLTRYGVIFYNALALGFDSLSPADGAIGVAGGATVAFNATTAGSIYYADTPAGPALYKIEPASVSVWLFRSGAISPVIVDGAMQSGYSGPGVGVSGFSVPVSFTPNVAFAPGEKITLFARWRDKMPKPFGGILGNPIVYPIRRPGFLKSAFTVAP
jgi:hypothetical protein